MTTLTLSPSYTPTREQVRRPQRSASRRPRAAAARQSSSSNPLRLTGRGRLVVILALLVLTFAALSLTRVMTQASQPGTAPTAPVNKVWVVEPGDTLWSIATQVAPNDDPRATVRRLVELNSLDSAGVFAGEKLIVPANG
jgi:LysM repeat protein